MLLLDNKAILRLYNVFLHDSKVVLLTEYLKGGTLRKFIRESPPINEEDAKEILV